MMNTTRKQEMTMAARAQVTMLIARASAANARLLQAQPASVR